MPNSTRRNRAHAPAVARVSKVHPEDRAAACRSLWRFNAPSEAALKAKTTAEFIAALHAIETLIGIAQPLSDALAEHLAPWLAESRRRREQILADNRRADARLGGAA